MTGGPVGVACRTGLSQWPLPSYDEAGGPNPRLQKFLSSPPRVAFGMLDPLFPVILTNARYWRVGNDRRFGPGVVPSPVQDKEAPRGRTGVPPWEGRGASLVRRATWARGSISPSPWLAPARVEPQGPGTAAFRGCKLPRQIAGRSASNGPARSGGDCRDQHRGHCLRSHQRRPGDGHDARACVLLRRPRPSQELPGDHDAELHLDGRRDRRLGGRRLLAGLLRGQRRVHRQPRLGLPQPCGSGSRTVGSHHPRPCSLLLPGDVRHHHPGADHRCLRRSRALQELPQVPRHLEPRGIRPARALDLGRGLPRPVGRARLRRGYGGAHQRRFRRPRLGLGSRIAQVPPW